MQYITYVCSCCTTSFHPCDFVRHFPVRHFPVCHFPVLQIPVLQIQLSPKFARFESSLLQSVGNIIAREGTCIKHASLIWIYRRRHWALTDEWLPQWWHDQAAWRWSTLFSVAILVRPRRAEFAWNKSSAVCPAHRFLHWIP